VLMATRQSDCCVSTHRCHAHYLAKGGDLAAMIDEFYSLESGCSRGLGGSMHLCDVRANMWGSGAIVGGGIPIAVGIGLALKQRDAGNVSIGFSGDGGTDEGSFYESLNLAALLNLPVLFVVENNGYATLTPLAERQKATDIVAKAEAFGVDGFSVDGNDALAVYKATQWILKGIRATSRPFLLEAVTYRMGAHVGPGADFGDGQRPEAERDKWLARDPLALLRAHIAGSVPRIGSRLAEIERGVLAEVDAAFEGSKRRFAAVNTLVGLVAPAPVDARMV